MRWMLAWLAFAAVGCKQSSSTEAHDVNAIDAAVTQIAIDVRADGSLAIDGRTVADENALAEEARVVAQKTPLLHAVIYVAEGVAYDRVISTEQALKRGGVTHMSFGVRGSKSDATAP